MSNIFDDWQEFKISSSPRFTVSHNKSLSRNIDEDSNPTNKGKSTQIIDDNANMSSDKKDLVTEPPIQAYEQHFDNYNRLERNDPIFGAHKYLNTDNSGIQVASYSSRFFTNKGWLQLFISTIILIGLASRVLNFALYFKVIASHKDLVTNTSVQSLTVLLIPDFLFTFLPFIVEKVADFFLKSNGPKFYFITNMIYNTLFGLLMIFCFRQQRFVPAILCAVCIFVQFLAMITATSYAIVLGDALIALEDVLAKATGARTFIFVLISVYMVIRVLVGRVFFHNVVHIGSGFLQEGGYSVIPFITVMEILEFIVMNWCVGILVAIEKAVFSGIVLSYYSGSFDEDTSMVDDDSIEVRSSKHPITWYAKVALVKSLGSLTGMAFLGVFLEMPIDFLNLTAPILLIDARIPFVCQVIDAIKAFFIAIYPIFTSFNVVRIIGFGETMGEARAGVRNTVTKRHGKEAFRMNLLLNYIVLRIIMYIVLVIVLPFLLVIVVVFIRTGNVNFITYLGFEFLPIHFFLSSLTIAVLIATPLKAAIEAAVTCLITNPAGFKAKTPELAVLLSDLYNIPV